MKPFLQFIIEANYMRFLKKNKNLTDDQRDQIDKYYSKTNTQAGAKVKWQSREVKKWEFSDFETHMSGYKSGRKATFKKPSIPGSHGEDYWEVKLRTKGYYAAIPLTQETATYMNSGRYGCDGADYCIGYDGDASNWDDIVIGEQQVPIYITNGAEKWVVMIYEGNRKYDIWDKMNNFSKKNSTVIPGFSVSKNLLTSPLKKLYDDLREDFFSERSETYEDAKEDFDKLVQQMEDAQQEIEDNGENFDSDMNDIKTKTLRVLQKKADPLEDRSNELEGEVAEIEKMMKNQDAPYSYNGSRYSEDEFQSYLNDKTDAYDIAYEAWDTINDQINEIDDIEPYDMPYKHDEYDWEGEVPDEDGAWEIKNDISHYPDVSWFSDLDDYSGGQLDTDDVKQAVWSYIFEGGWNESASDVLHKHGIYRPE